MFQQAAASGTGQACCGRERTFDGAARNTGEENKGNAAGSRPRRSVIKSLTRVFLSYKEGLH